VTNPRRSPSAATVVVSVSAAVVAVCAVIVTAVILSDRSQTGTPMPAPLARTPAAERKVFDAAKVTADVRNVLINDYKLQVGNVTCPPDEPVQTGFTFTCQAMVDDTQKSVLITVKSPDGDFEVGQPQ
jgi:hypothetical protein